MHHTQAHTSCIHNFRSYLESGIYRLYPQGPRSERARPPEEAVILTVPFAG
jgi:hypothetical protein